MPKLENWAIVTTDNDPYKAPEMKARRFQGNVYGHPNFPDGTAITTSHIAETKIETRTVITGSGSEYELGEPSEDYLRVYPNCKERVFQEA